MRTALKLALYLEKRGSLEGHYIWSDMLINALTNAYTEGCKDSIFCAENLKKIHPPLRVDNWQPINTAPRDGKFFLVYGKGLYAIYRWEAEYGHFENEGDSYLDWHKARGWMPLPELPKYIEEYNWVTK